MTVRAEGEVRVEVEEGVAAAPPTPDAAAGAESATIVELAERPDCPEGAAAFLERRAPRFVDRERP